MIVNPDKFQLILQDKGRSDNINIVVEIRNEIIRSNSLVKLLGVRNEKIRSTSLVKLLGVHIDDKLNFSKHINKICKSTGNQLNALIRLK